MKKKIFIGHEKERVLFISEKIWVFNVYATDNLTNNGKYFKKQI